MAHFAKLNAYNIVEQVVVIHNNELLDSDGNESEELGIQFCNRLFGHDGTWVQTSYNGNFRKNFASIKFKYDKERDAFIPPKPTQGEWELDDTTCLWVEVTD